MFSFHFLFKRLKPFDVLQTFFLIRMHQIKKKKKKKSGEDIMKKSRVILKFLLCSCFILSSFYFTFRTKEELKETKTINEFIQTKRNTGVLIIPPAGGLGDRLRPIVLGYFLSYLFNKKLVFPEVLSNEFMEPNFQGYKPFGENEGQIEAITDPQILNEMDWRTPNISLNKSTYSIGDGSYIKEISHDISEMREAKILDLSVRCNGCLKFIIAECEKATLSGHHFPNLKYLKHISQSGYAWQFALKNLFKLPKSIKNMMNSIKQDYYTISNPMVVDYLRNEDILYERFNLEYRRETRNKLERKSLLNDTDLDLEFFTFSVQYRSGDTFFGFETLRGFRFMQQKDVYYFVDKFLEEWKRIVIEREIRNEREKKKMESEGKNKSHQIKNKRLIPIIFITGDNPSVISYLNSVFSYLHIPTFTSEEFGELAHTKQTDKSQTRTYLDWWLLSQSNHILASQSGFPISAAKMQCVPISIYFNPPPNFDEEQLKYTPRFMEFDRRTGLCGNERTSLVVPRLFSYIDEKLLADEVERRMTNNIRSLSVQYNVVFKKM